MLPVITVVSWLFSRQNSFKEWFGIVFFSGVRKISRHMTLLSNKERSDHEEKAWWETIFEVWWGFSIKYFMPAVLSYGIINTFRSDVREKYGGYPIEANLLGWGILILGIMAIIIPVFLCTTWEPFSYDVDQPFELMAKEHYTQQEIKRRKVKEQEEKKKRDMDSSVITNNKSRLENQTPRSIVETEHNLKLGDADK